MNNTFDIKRLGLLLQKDLGEYYFRFKSKIATIFIVYAGIMLYTWVSGLIFGESVMDMGTRLFIITLLTIVATISAPSVLYGHINHKLRGIDYAMLPASSLEKFFTMILMTTIFTPILCTFSLLTIDTILSFLPLNSEVVANIFTFDLSTLSLFRDMNNLMPSTSVGFWVNDSISELIILSSIFLLGNIIFKRSKISRTILTIILWMILIIVAISVIKAIYTSDSASLEYYNLGYFFGYIISWFENASSFIRVGMSLISYFISFTILFFTYHKIKKQQY